MYDVIGASDFIFLTKDVLEIILIEARAQANEHDPTASIQSCTSTGTVLQF